MMTWQKKVPPHKVWQNETKFITVYKRSEHKTDNV